MSSEKKEAKGGDDSLLTPLVSFFTDSKKLIEGCDQPQRDEYLKIAVVTGGGFVLLGLVGYAIKVFHLSFNNLLLK